MFDKWIKLLKLPKRHTLESVLNDLVEGVANGTVVSPFPEEPPTPEEPVKVQIDTCRLPHAFVAQTAARVLFPAQKPPTFVLANMRHWHDHIKDYRLDNRDSAHIVFDVEPKTPDNPKPGPAPTASVTVTAAAGIHDELLAILALWVQDNLRSTLRPQIDPTPAEALAWATEVLKGRITVLTQEMCVAYGLNDHWAGGGLTNSVFLRAYAIREAADHATVTTLADPFYHDCPTTRKVREVLASHRENKLS